MLNCDICKKPIEGRRDIRKPISLPYVYACKAYQNKDFDLCDDCKHTLNEVIEQAKYNFVNGNYTYKEDTE